MEIIPFVYVQAKQPNQKGSDDHYQVLTEHMYSSKYTTVADSDFQIRAGGRSSRPCDRGAVSIYFFRSFESQFGLVAKCYFRNKKKEVNVNCDYVKKKLSRQRTTKIQDNINMMYITTFRLYTTSLHQEKSSTAHAQTDETRCLAVIDCFSAAVIGS